jgi:hypothetical protein
MLKPPAVSIELFFASMIAETQRARRLLLYVLTLTAVFMLGSLRGWPQSPPSGEPTVTLGIEVNLPDRAVFYIPVVGDGEILGIVPFPEGPLAGIRITPRMHADSVKIEVSALAAAKKTLSEATCEEVRSWKSEDAGTYDGKKDESLLLSGLGRLGLPVFEVKVVQAYRPPPGGFHHPYPNFSAFCGCNFPEPRSIILDGRPASGVAGTLSYPDAGKCVEISGCGQCCRMAVPASVQQGSMTPDQVNTTGWDKGWTNLVNDAEQTFTPSLTRLVGVEVQLVVGNAGAAEDHLTLTVLDATGRTVAVVTESVQTADCDRVMFVIPEGGVKVTPGQTYGLKLSGGTTFGWKYIVGGYEKGAATFNGKPLLPKERSTFLFRTFGAE